MGDRGEVGLALILDALPLEAEADRAVTGGAPAEESGERVRLFALVERDDERELLRDDDTFLRLRLTLEDHLPVTVVEAGRGFVDLPDGRLEVERELLYRRRLGMADVVCILFEEAGELVLRMQIALKGC